MKSAGPSKKIDRSALVFLAGILFVSTLGISHQSFWIDETYTAIEARQITIQSGWHEMLRTGGSSLQMPLYMMWIWICGKFIGSSEIALRAVNLFWVLPGLIALWRALARQPRLQMSVFLVTIFSPFVWYYLDEARPYAMQIGAGLLLAAALCRWSEKTISSPSAETIWVWGFVTALVALSGASMLGMIWAGAAISAAIFLLPKERLLKLRRDHIFAWLVATVLLAALGFYYLWTLKAGARASGAASTDSKNVAFIGYELLGFAGLGPGRLEIRDGGLQVFKPYLPELAMFAALVLALIFFAVRETFKNYPRKKFLGLTVIVAVPAVFILAAGFVLHFRVLGRHFAPLLTALVILLGVGVNAAWRRNRMGKIIVVVFFAFCLASSFSLRFGSRHAKDDYRDAAGLGREALARGESVWWSADLEGAWVYHLPVAKQPEDAKAAVLLVNPENGSLQTLPKPDWVLVSKPDLYDGHGAIQQYLIQNNYRIVQKFPAFNIWRRQ